LALDKCLPRRDFLQVLEIPDEKNEKNSDFFSPLLEYDLEWLSVLKSSNHLWNLTPRTSYMPGKESSERFNFVPSEDEMKTIEDLFDGNLTIPQNFVQSAPAYSATDSKKAAQPSLLCNAQTTDFAARLGVLDLPKEWMKMCGMNTDDHAAVSNPEEIPLFDDDGSRPDDDAVERSGETIKNQQGAVTVSKLSLPPPRHQMDSTNSEMENRVECSEAELASPLEAAPIGDAAQAALPDNGMKTFKRRNVAIYGANDDDEN